eukprot:5125593-Prorocentrum_lima.AAC.1
MTAPAAQSGAVPVMAVPMDQTHVPATAAPLNTHWEYVQYLPTASTAPGSHSEHSRGIDMA